MKTETYKKWKTADGIEFEDGPPGEKRIRISGVGIPVDDCVYAAFFSRVTLAEVVTDPDADLDELARRMVKEGCLFHRRQGVSLNVTWGDYFTARKWLTEAFRHVRQQERERILKKMETIAADYETGFPAHTAITYVMKRI